MLTDDPVDSDGVISIVNTVIMPILTEANLEKGVMVHIDDCLCEDCSCDRSDIIYGSTILLELTNTESTMIARLLPTEARALARELLKHTEELENLRDRGAFDNVQ